MMGMSRAQINRRRQLGRLLGHNRAHHKKSFISICLTRYGVRTIATGEFIRQGLRSRGNARLIAKDWSLKGIGEMEVVNSSDEIRARFKEGQEVKL